MHYFDQLPKIIHKRAEQIINRSTIHFGDGCYSLDPSAQYVRIDKRQNIYIRFNLESALYSGHDCKITPSGMIEVAIPARSYLYWKATGVIAARDLPERSMLSTLRTCNQYFCLNPEHQRVIPFTRGLAVLQKDSLNLLNRELTTAISRKPKVTRIEIYTHSIRNFRG